MAASDVHQVILNVAQNTEALPKTTAEAVALLDAGSADFASLGASGGTHEFTLSPESIGLPSAPGTTLRQEPFAAAIGCADARVPLELVFGHSGNDIFVARVAGNTPGSDVLGSLHYAMANLPTIRAVLVLGHSKCGAITAAVDALLHPESYLAVVQDPPLRGIVDSLLASVRLASLALAEAYGSEVTTSDRYREALIETATVANAAVTATMLNHDLDREVHFGVYDLERRSVGVLGNSSWIPGLQSAPIDDGELTALLLDVSRSGVLSSQG